MAVQFRRSAYIDLDDLFNDRPEGVTGWDLRDDIKDMGVTGTDGRLRPIYVELRAVSGRLSRRAAMMRFDLDTGKFTVVDDVFDQADEEEYGYTLAGVTYQGNQILKTLEEVMRAKVKAEYSKQQEEAAQNRKKKMGEQGVLVIGWDKPNRETLRTDIQFDVSCFRFRSSYRWEADVKFIVTDYVSAQRTQKYNFTASGVLSQGYLTLKELVLNYPAEKYPVKEIYWKDTNMFAFENIYDNVRKELQDVIWHTVRKTICG